MKVDSRRECQPIRRFNTPANHHNQQGFTRKQGIAMELSSWTQSP
jgi:hypothetical protein